MKRMDISPTAAAPTPASASGSAPQCHSFVWELLDFSSSQEVQHHLVALLNGILLGYLHLSASACLPASHLSHRLPACSLLVCPQAAMVEEVLPHLGCCVFTPPAFIVLLVARPF